MNLFELFEGSPVKLKQFTGRNVLETLALTNMESCVFDHVQETVTFRSEDLQFVLRHDLDHDNVVYRGQIFSFNPTEILHDSGYRTDVEAVIYNLFNALKTLFDVKSPTAAPGSGDVRRLDSPALKRDTSHLSVVPTEMLHTKSKLKLKSAAKKKAEVEPMSTREKFYAKIKHAFNHQDDISEMVPAFEFWERRRNKLGPYFPKSFRKAWDLALENTKDDSYMATAMVLAVKHLNLEG